MTVSRQRVTVLVACALVSCGALAQLQLPNIVQLPTEDFVWVWGENVPVDKRSRPEFTIQGGEQGFLCMLTGSFRPNSRMRDFYNKRDFEQTLGTTLYFIQDATAALNQLYLSRDLDWAIMDCAVPQGEQSEEKSQERLDKAIERAERQRDRRRAREDD